MNDLNLGVVQLTSTDVMAANLAAVLQSLRTAVGAGAKLIVFPENTLFFRLVAGSGLQAPAWDGAELKQLKAACDEAGVACLITTPMQAKGDSSKFENATVLFEPGTEPRAVYKKIHLFDVDVPGAPPVRESEHFVPGQLPAIIEVSGWKIGLSVCYDLRFAELYSRYAQSVDLIVVPSAFLVPTGQAHWHVLLRARAIENQCYVAAPAQAGEHIGAGQNRRHTYGHSLVVDPWGRVDLELAGGPEVQVVSLKRAKIQEVRRQIPMQSHRRL